ncbi:hypothetical protein HPB47_023544 [Ixodes persulcatus]|uniref:Uncharacterized protein n=1 Tax=Ixodes persulcatus TaxID=34615 RepID=A0AC60Q736_IXOPE|nr:hypothetical protein HPB47_023544 [Ixodes persulcatus]
MPDWASQCGLRPRFGMLSLTLTRAMCLAWIITEDTAPKSHLTEAAKAWLRSRNAEIASWEDFEDRFRRTFFSQTRAAERWSRIQDRVQQRTRCGTELVWESTPIYMFGNSSVLVTDRIRKCKANIGVDGVLARHILILVVPEEAKIVVLLIGRTLTKLTYLTYAILTLFLPQERLPSRQKLQLKASEESIIQKDRINWITLTAEQELTSPVVYRHGGQGVLIDMTFGEVTVPMCSASHHETAIRK